MKKIIPVLISLAAVVGAVLYVKNKEPIREVVTNTIRDTVNIYIDDVGTTHATIEHNPEAKQEMKQAISKEFLSYTTDTLAPALNIAKEEIDRLMRVNAKLSGQVALKKRDTIYRTLEFQGDYMTIRVKDTIADYSYNATLDFMDYHKKNWLFGRDRYYTDISSPDTAFRIHGVQHYRRPFTPVKDRFSISARAGMTLSKRPSIQTGFRARFNPDGILSPYAGVGREFYFSKKPGYYVEGGVEFNFYRK